MSYPYIGAFYISLRYFDTFYPLAGCIYVTFTLILKLKLFISTGNYIHTIENYIRNLQNTCTKPIYKPKAFRAIIKCKHLNVKRGNKGLTIYSCICVVRLDVIQLSGKGQILALIWRIFQILYLYSFL